MSNIKLLCGDCLEEMDKLIAEGVIIDAIITDPPYNLTACHWDKIIPFEPMWERLNKLIKPNGAIVLFGSEPFSSYLRLSNIKNYKYDWVWEKTKATGFFDVKKRPLKDNENILIFYKYQPTYNPQMTKADKVYKRGFVKRKKSDCYGKEKPFEQKETGMRYPKRIIRFGNADTRGILHPTQKSVKLLEFLIRTYTNEGELVLDFTAGSFSTAVACVNTNRNFIGIEKDEQYFKIGQQRINQATAQGQLKL